jgi:glycosyltransferase involved in cell wall biosynthesis
METKTLVVVPAYNCERQIARVLDSLCSHEQHFSKLIVIDNKSTDGTLDVARSWIPRFKNKLVVRQNTQNFNLGGTLKIAFETAISDHFDRLVIIHGDDQAEFKDVLPFLATDESNNLPELVIGARFHKDSKLIGYSKFRRLGNLVLNKITGLIFRSKIDDMIAGLNIFSVEFLRRLPFRNFPDDLTFDSNILFWSLANKSKPIFVPITWKDEDQVSNAKVLSQATKIVTNLLSVRLRGTEFFYLDRSQRGNDYTFSWKDFE